MEEEERTFEITGMTKAERDDLLRRFMSAEVEHVGSGVFSVSVPISDVADLLDWAEGNNLDIECC